MTGILQYATDTKQERYSPSLSKGSQIAVVPLIHGDIFQDPQ